MLLIIAYLARRRIILGAKPEEFLEAYFLGGRTLGWLVAGLSMAVTCYSAGTFIGGPGLAYGLGYMWVFVYPAQGMAALLTFMMLGRKFAIVARRIKAISMMDAIRARYGSILVEYIGAVATIVFISCYILPQFFGGARALEAVTGFPYVESLITFIVLCGIYTALGGLLGESWTDMIAGIVGGVMLIVLISAVLAATGQYGGVIGISKTLEGVSPVFVKGSPTLFNLALSMVVLIGIGIVSLPHSAVRVMTVKDIKSLKYGIIIGTIWMAIANIIPGITGCWARVFFPDLPVADLALPTVVAEVMPPILAGVVIALVIGAGLTTIDSMLLVVSSTFVKNMAMAIKPDMRPETSKKLSYITIGVVTVIIIYFALSPPAFLEWVILYAIGGLVAVYFASLMWGLYWKRANKYGALASMIGGIPVFIISDIYLKPYLQGIHPVIPAFIVSNLLMIVVSLLTPKPPREVIKLFWGRSK